MADRITPDICIYHAPCQDGFTAAWAIWKRWPDIDYFCPAFYGKEPPDVAGKHVLLVDYSYKAPMLEALGKVAASVTILDHHKSAQEDLAVYIRDALLDDAGDLVAVNAEMGQPPIQALFDMNKSGAMMAWEYAFPNEPAPALIRHVQDRDLWRFELEGTREVCADLFSREYDFTTWSQLAKQAQSFDGLATLVEAGAAILRQHDKFCRELIAVGKRTMVIGGHSVPVVNAPYFMASDMAGQMAEGQPFAATWFENDKGERVFSLRSREGGVDVSTIAAGYDGGGHAQAAGFTAAAGWEGDAPATIPRALEAAVWYGLTSVPWLAEAPRRIYVASSWRNPFQQQLVAELRDAGHEVYDFRNPAPGNDGFAWSAIDRDWLAWTPEAFARHVQTHPTAADGFAFDKSALDWCDTCVLVLPCGRSAHLEAGYAADQGKRVVWWLHDDKFEPELMYLLGHDFVVGRLDPRAGDQDGEPSKGGQSIRDLTGRGAPLTAYDVGEADWPPAWRDLPEASDEADLFEQMATLTDDMVLRTAVNCLDNCMRMPGSAEGVAAGMISAHARFLVGLNPHADLEQSGREFGVAWTAMAKEARVLDPNHPRACKHCGCTDAKACQTPDGPCCWISADVCSAPACVAKEAAQ
jgi:hypothetical protein